MKYRLGVRWVSMVTVVIVLAAVATMAVAVARPMFTTAAANAVLKQNQTFTLTSQEQKVTAAAQKIDQEVVQVENVGVALGSGVIATASGYIITNNHVVANGTAYNVTLWNGKTMPAKLIGTSVADDLAVIKVDTTGLAPATFANSSKLTVGQSVLAVGNPLGLGETVTLGVVSAVSRTVGEPTGAYIPNAIQTSAAINPGNSGGALASLDGQVVGIPTLAASSPEGGAAAGIGFAIPSNRVITIAQQLITTGKVTHTGRPFLGVAVQDVSSSSGGAPGTQQPGQQPGGQGAVPTGVVIAQLTANGPAAKAGIQQGDLLVSLAGHTVENSDTLYAILANLSVGQKVPAIVERQTSSGGVSKVNVTITLGELPANQ